MHGGIDLICERSIAVTPIQRLSYVSLTELPLWEPKSEADYHSATAVPGDKEPPRYGVRVWGCYVGRWQEVFGDRQLISLIVADSVIMIMAWKCPVGIFISDYHFLRLASIIL